jgi:hypothetical protein
VAAEAAAEAVARRRWLRNRAEQFEAAAEAAAAERRRIEAVGTSLAEEKALLDHKLQVSEKNEEAVE